MALIGGRGRGGARPVGACHFRSIGQNFPPILNEEAAKSLDLQAFRPSSMTDIPSLRRQIHHYRYLILIDG
ncbi:hypothetical protein NXC24_PB00015 (plasmid) [Rhizobium sp. NXC24]|nr:hypothetical protein NXC24_PB00015 [Rhizobium sp. NXC24]